jgi:hypothetical protein
MNFTNFTEGYEQSLVNMERHIEASINRHQGAKTPEACVKVLNDVIFYIHQEKLQLSGAQTEECDVEIRTEFSVEDLINSMIQDAGTFKGGIQ